MKAETWLAWSEAIAATALLIVAVFLTGWPSGPALMRQLPLTVELAVALTILGAYAVWMPKGDALDITAPVVFAASVMLDSLIAGFIVLVIRCLVGCAPVGRPTGVGTVEHISRRIILVVLTNLALGGAVFNGLYTEHLGAMPIRIALAAAAFMIADTLLEQIYAAIRFRAPLISTVLGTLRLQGWTIAAKMSVAVLAVLLLPALRYWGLIITIALLFVMRQAFSLLLEVRASYTSTVEVLARAIEAYDPARRGHAERVAGMVSDAGRMFGFQGRRLTDLTYAALFHDVGLLGADDAEELPGQSSADVLSNVGFLSGAVPILRILDSRGSEETSFDEDDLVSAYLIVTLSALDAELSTGGHEDAEVARTIGARLYSSTRRRADRVVRYVERDARGAVILRPEALAT